MQMSILNPKDVVRCKIKKNNTFYFVAHEKIKDIDKLKEDSKPPKTLKLKFGKRLHVVSVIRKCKTNYTKYKANT